MGFSTKFLPCMYKLQVSKQGIAQSFNCNRFFQMMIRDKNITSNRFEKTLRAASKKYAIAITVTSANLFRTTRIGGQEYIYEGQVLLLVVLVALNASFFYIDELFL